VKWQRSRESYRIAKSLYRTFVGPHGFEQRYGTVLCEPFSALSAHIRHMMHACTVLRTPVGLCTVCSRSGLPASSIGMEHRSVKRGSGYCIRPYLFLESAFALCLVWRKHGCMSIMQHVLLPCIEAKLHGCNPIRRLRAGFLRFRVAAFLTVPRLRSDR